MRTVRTLAQRVAPFLVVFAASAAAPAYDSYVWKIKSSGKAIVASRVTPPVYELGMEPRDQGNPLGGLVPTQGAFTPFDVGFDPFEGREFSEWIRETFRGKHIRKNVTLELLRGGQAVYGYTGTSCDLVSVGFPGFEDKGRADFAVTFRAKSRLSGAQGNPLFEDEGRTNANPLFEVRISMGDGSVRPLSADPILMDVEPTAEGQSVVRIKPIRCELKREAAAGYRSWLAEIETALALGLDVSRLARPMSVRYVTRKGTCTIRLSRVFVRSAVELADGSVRVALQPDALPGNAEVEFSRG